MISFFPFQDMRIEQFPEVALKKNDPLLVAAQ